MPRIGSRSTHTSWKPNAPRPSPRAFITASRAAKRAASDGTGSTFGATYSSSLGDEQPVAHRRACAPASAEPLDVDDVDPDADHCTTVTVGSGSRSSASGRRCRRSGRSAGRRPAARRAGGRRRRPRSPTPSRPAGRSGGRSPASTPRIVAGSSRSWNRTCSSVMPVVVPALTSGTRITVRPSLRPAGDEHLALGWRRAASCRRAAGCARPRRGCAADPAAVDDRRSRHPRCRSA